MAKEHIKPLVAPVVQARAHRRLDDARTGFVYVRQREAPTRPLGHVGADPPGVDIMSKLLIRTGAGGVAYAPGPGLPANVCVVLNEIRSLWIAFPAMEKAEFRANKDYETSCFFN